MFSRPGISGGAILEGPRVVGHREGRGAGLRIRGEPWLGPNGIQRPPAPEVRRKDLRGKQKKNKKTKETLNKRENTNQKTLNNN